MKALITGGAGFIGLHLTKNLIDKDYDVTIVDNFSRGVRDRFLEEISGEDTVKLKTIDLMDASALDGLGTDYDYIVHLAAIIGVQNVLERPYDVLKNNAILLMNLIEYAKKQIHLKRVLFASTSEVYAGTLQYHSLEIPTPETTPLTITPTEHPRTSYMLSKIYGEALLHQSGIPFTIFRPHNFYGPRMGMSHVIPELLRKTYFDEGNGELEIFSAEHRRTFCYIDDAVEIIARLAESSDANGGTFNIGSENPEYTMREVGQIVLKTMGKDYRIKELSPSPGSPERRCPSMEKTIACIGYEPKVSLEEGVRRTYDWYKENIFDGSEVSAK